MSLSFSISERLRKALDKLAERDHALAAAVRKKMGQIAGCDGVSIEHFKNLRGNMSHLKRVHVGSFVLLFRAKGNSIIFEALEHHDNAY